MSSMPECKKCGAYVHHGPCLCDDCSEALRTENERYREALEKIIRSTYKDYEELEENEDGFEFDACGVIFDVNEIVREAIRGDNERN